MTNINLLPQNLRAKEARQKKQKKPHSLAVEFVHHPPADQEPASPHQPSTLAKSQSSKGEVREEQRKDKIAAKENFWSSLKEEVDFLKPVEERQVVASSPNVTSPQEVKLKQDKEQIKPDDIGSARGKPLAKDSSEKKGSSQNLLEAAKVALKKLPQVFKDFKLKDIQKLWRKRETKGTAEEPRRVLSVDLLKEEIILQRSPRPELIKLFTIVIVIILAANGIAFYYKTRSIVIKSEIAILQEEAVFLDQKLATLEKMTTGLTVSDQLIKIVSGLLATRIDWLPFLNEIEQRTLKSVYYTSLEAQDLTSVTLVGRARSLEDALTQINIFKTSSDFIKDLRVEGITLREEEVKIGRGEDGKEESLSVSFVNFVLRFNINPEWISENYQD